MIDANAKYMGAWQEISARVQARDRVLLSFIALAAALVGLSLSRADLGFTAVGVGYASLATALLGRHHDIIIGHLGAFQRDLEIAENTQYGENTQYRWLSGKYIQDVYKARAIRDWAQFLFIGFGAVPALYIAGRSLGGPFSLTTALWYGSLACSMGAVFVVWKTRKDRERMAGLE